MDDAHRILVVDDELGPREALRMIFKVKISVLTAVNGPDALQVLSNTPPDIVLLDIKMREMNGIEVLRAIKETDASIGSHHDDRPCLVANRSRCHDSRRLGISAQAFQQERGRGGY